jgi:hypothetical protein
MVQATNQAIHACAEPSSTSWRQSIMPLTSRITYWITLREVVPNRTLDSSLSTGLGQWECAIVASQEADLKCCWAGMLGRLPHLIGRYSLDLYFGSCCGTCHVLAQGTTPWHGPHRSQAMSSLCDLFMSTLKHYVNQDHVGRFLADWEFTSTYI